MKNQQKIMQNAEDNLNESMIDAPDPRSSFDSYSCDNYSINVSPASKFFKQQQGSQAFDDDSQESEEGSKSIIYIPVVKKSNNSEK